MKTYPYFLASVILLSTWILPSCRSNNTLDGPELNELYGPFGIKSTLALSAKTVDFAAGQTVSLSLLLSKTTSWTVTITGLSTGAKKLITGKSKTLDAGNATWNGSTTLFPVFNKEKCQVAVSFDGQSVVLYDTVTVLSQKPKDTGVLLAGFQNGDLDKIYLNGNIDYSSDGDSIGISNRYPFAPYLGTNSLVMSGVDKNRDTYIGNVLYTSTLFGATPYFQIPSTDPNEVYFNIAVKGTGLPNSRVIVQLTEDSNGDKKYTEATDNRYVLHIPITWNGWKMVSAKYAEFENDGGKDAPLPSPGLPKDISKILQIRFIHMTAVGAGGSASRVVLDYPILTVGKAFEP